MTRARAAAAISEATLVARETAEETDLLQHLQAIDDEMSADDGDNAEHTARITIDYTEATANLNALQIVRETRDAGRRCP